MIINKRLFDECYLCEDTEGIGRVCLRGDRTDLLPKELIAMAMEEDKEEYLSSCFSIDVFLDGSGAIVTYMGFYNPYIELCVCDNVEEVLEYYKKNIDK